MLCKPNCCHRCCFCFTACSLLIAFWHCPSDGFGRRIMCGEYANTERCILCTLTIEIYCLAAALNGRPTKRGISTRPFENNFVEAKWGRCIVVHECDLLKCVFLFIGSDSDAFEPPQNEEKMDARQPTPFQMGTNTNPRRILQISLHYVWVCVHVIERWSVDGASELRKMIDRTK